MDFTSLGKIVIDLGFGALGTAFGVPALAPVAAGLAKTALGLPDTATPADIAKAAKENPVALEAANGEAAEMWPALAEIAKHNAKQSSEINRTIRAEIDAGVSWWHWRHLLGYVVGGWIVGVAAAMVKHLWTADAAAISTVVPLLNSTWGYFGAACGLLGYVAMDTTRRKAAAAGQDIPTIIGGIVKTLRK